MPFYLRKSISAGPFRFNLSKSGLGLSVGVRGFRIGTGPKGHYIHAGANGFYYRASLGGAGRKPATSPRKLRREGSPPSSPNVPPDNVEMIDIESGDVLAMADARLQDMVDEINHKCGQMRMSVLLGCACGGVAAGAALATANFLALLPVPLAYLAGRWWDSHRRTTVLFYDLEAKLADAYGKLVEAFEAVATCDRAWHVSSAGEVRDITTWKRNAGAGYLVKRTTTALKLQPPAVVKSNLDPPHVPVGKQDLYFFPDFVLLLQGSRAGAILYDQLNVHVKHVRYIECEKLPGDAQVIDRTWQHPNKSGGPDRRFAFNKQIPVCLYEELHLTSPTGLRELIQLSKAGNGAAFATMTQALAKYGPAARGDRQLLAAQQQSEQSSRVEPASRKATFVACVALAVCSVVALTALVLKQRPINEAPQPRTVAAHQGSPTSARKEAEAIDSGTLSPPLTRESLTTGAVQVRKADPISTTRVLHVTVAIRLDGGSKPFIVGATNLPSGTKLTVELRSDTYSGQQNVSVQEGQFRAGPFTQRGGPLRPGTYFADVSSPTATEQPASVRSVIGTSGENLQGTATKSIPGGRAVAVSARVVIGAAEAAKAHPRSNKDRNARLMETCKRKCSASRSNAMQGSEAFDWNQCYLLCLADTR